MLLNAQDKAGDEVQFDGLNPNAAAGYGKEGIGIKGEIPTYGTLYESIDSPYEYMNFEQHS